MKNALKLPLLLICLLVFSLSYAQDTSPALTLIDDFDTGYTSGQLGTQWWTYVDTSGSTLDASVDDETVYNGTGAIRMDVKLATEGYVGLGTTYTDARNWQAGQGLIFRIRANRVGIPMSIVLHMRDETQTSTASPGVTPFGCPFTTPEGSVDEWIMVTLEWDCFQRLTWVGEEGVREFTPNPITSFEIAFANPVFNSYSVWMDDIRVISDSDLNRRMTVRELFANVPTIKVSQIGYRPSDFKLLITTGRGRTFSIVDDTTGEVVYESELISWGQDRDTNHNIQAAYFEVPEASGTYRIVLANGTESHPFTIAEDVYNDVLILAARALYLQRSGIAIQDAEISGVDLEAGHTAPAVLWGDPDETPIDVSGGWYDAGDFGRYIPTASFAVNQLLIGFEANPEFFADGSLNIPESGNGQPDLLDEIRWELDWMLKMQREDGAVHHKVTTRNFPDFGTLPAEDTDQMYVFDVSSADTAYFAGTMAQAARTFETYDAEYASTLLDAAQRAWAWLEQNPDQVPAGGFQNPPPDEYPMQGGYDFVGAEDVPRMWAAAELFNTTGEAVYETAFAGYFAAVTPERKQAMSWANVYPMALYAYLSSSDANRETTAAVTAVFRQQAEEIYQVARMSGYHVALNDGVPGFEFVWGSNQVALAHGLYLMMANTLFPDKNYQPTALQQVQYVLGTNPLAKTYISGIGADSVLYPHHNVSFRMQRAVPGFVTEGANSQGLGGDKTLEALWDLNVPSAMRYTDDWNSWASNEPTIDANATFVALVAYFAQP